MTHRKLKNLYIPGTTKRCHKCGEHLPATEEFFRAKITVTGVYTLRSPCLACIAEKQRENLAKRPCCVPGCAEPRVYLTDPRCRRHSSERNRAAYARRKAQQPAEPEQAEALFNRLVPPGTTYEQAVINLTAHLNGEDE